MPDTLELFLLLYQDIYIISIYVLTHTPDEPSAMFYMIITAFAPAATYHPQKSKVK